MFRKLRSIPHIHKLLLQGDQLILLKGSAEISSQSLDGEICNWTRQLKSKGRNISRSSASIFVNLDKGALELEFANGLEKKEFSPSLKYASPTSPVTFFLKKNNNKKSTLVWDSRNQQELGEFDFYPGKISFIYGDFYFNSVFRQNHLLNCYSLSDFSLYWSLNVSEYAKWTERLLGEVPKQGVINSIVGVHENKMWLGLTNGNMICIEMATGAITDEVVVSSESRKRLGLESDSFIPFGYQQQLDKKSNEIIGLRDFSFMQTDLSHRPYVRNYFSIEEECLTKNIKPEYRNLVYPIWDKYILFCDGQEGKIGLFDRESHSIPWTKSLGIKNEGITQILEMEFFNNFWYIIDRYHTLHIYKTH